MGHVDALTGGLRLHVGDAGGSQERVGLAGALLRAIPGVSVVAADPSTGSISIAYDPRRTAARETAPVVEVLAGELVPYVPRPAVTAGPATRWAAWLGRTVALVAVEIALQRVLGPLFPRRC
jgi:hypothetical protein